MDKTIPHPAAKLLNFIYETETGKTAPGCYDVIFANRQNRLAKPVTKMTIGEVLASQKIQRNWAKPASSATGAPQFMYNTLIGLKKELGLRMGQVFDGNLQDRLAYHLLKRRGYLQYMDGSISRSEFGKRLAMEWASFPVLENTQGAHRKLVRGQSYYAGDSLNKSLTSPATVEKILDSLKFGNFPAEVAVADEPAPTKKPTTPGTGAVVVVTFGVVLGTFWEWFSNLPCNVLGIFCGG